MIAARSIDAESGSRGLKKVKAVIKRNLPWMTAAGR